MNEKENLNEQNMEVDPKKLEKKFCEYCGNEINPEDKFCSKCGKSTEVREKIPLICQCGTPYQEGQKYCSKCGVKLEKSLLDKIKIEDSTIVEDEITEEDISENKGMAVLCYLGILLLIPLLTKPQSKPISL